MVSVLNQAKAKSDHVVAQAKKRELNGLLVSWIVGSVVGGALYGVAAKMNHSFQGWALAGAAGSGGVSVLVASLFTNTPGTSEATRRMLLVSEKLINGFTQAVESNDLLQERLNIHDGALTNVNHNLVVNTELTRQTISEINQFRAGVARMAQGAAASYGAQQSQVQAPDQSDQSDFNELNFQSEEYVQDSGYQSTEKPLQFNDNQEDGW